MHTPTSPNIANVAATPIHHTATSDEPWDAAANEARLAEREPNAAVYAEAYAAAEPNDFLHHEVGAAGSPEAANIEAVRTHLASVTDESVAAHLRAHLADAKVGVVPPTELPPVTFDDTLPFEAFTGTNGTLGPLVLDVQATAESVWVTYQREADTMPLRSYRHVSRAFYNRAWAIDAAMLRELSRILQGRMAGIRLSEDDIARRLAAAEGENGPRIGGTRLGSVEVLPMYGPISDRMNLMSDISGGTSTAEMTQLLRKALKDDSISAIVFDIDSPGGVTDGAPEFAAELRRAKGIKPIVGVVNTMAASAAYWYAAQMNEIVGSPSSEVGSIGVYAAHTDMSAANESAGMKVSYISAGPFKTEGNPDEPLTDEGRAAIQDQVNDFYDMFVADVAKGRDTTPDVVRESYGQGRTLLARKALAAGMVDRIDTLEATVRRLQRKPAAAGTRRGEDISEPRLALVVEAEGYVEPSAAVAALPSQPLRPDREWNQRMKGLLK